MNRARLLAAIVLLVAACTAYAQASLPAKLVLGYALTYGGMKIGEVTKTLQRQGDQAYTHETWTRPAGIASSLTSTEWLETGRFLVDKNRVVPQVYKEERRGDKKAHNHTVTFDWGRREISFDSGRKQGLPVTSQDQGSIFFHFMLQPLLGGDRVVYISDGEELERYTFVYIGRERLATVFGESDTIVLERISEKQQRREQECRAAGRSPSECPTEEFVIWLAPEKGYAPVKLKKRKKGQTLILTLRTIEGL